MDHVYVSAVGIFLTSLFFFSRHINARFPGRMSGKTCGIVAATFYGLPDTQPVVFEL